MCVAVGERLPRERGEDDGDEVAERREDEEARVALGGLEVAGDAEPDEEADVHAGVVPEEGSFAARVLRGEALREHHVDAGDVEAAAGEEEREADVEQRERAGRDACAAEHLQRHAADEQVAVRKEAAAQVTAEEVQAVVEGAEHTHQRGGLFHAEMQMLRRVEDQRRVEDGEAERREDLNEEQRGRSLRSLEQNGDVRNLHPAFAFSSSLTAGACQLVKQALCSLDVAGIVNHVDPSQSYRRSDAAARHAPVILRTLQPTRQPLQESSHSTPARSDAVSALVQRKACALS